MNERLRELRKKLKLTQKELSEKIGCSYRALQNYEANLREVPSKIIKLLNARLSINSQWFLTGEGEIFDKHISCGSKTDINQYNEMASLGEGVIMLTKIHAAKNRTHYDNMIKYLKRTVDIVEIEERSDSDKK